MDTLVHRYSKPPVVAQATAIFDDNASVSIYCFGGSIYATITSSKGKFVISKSDAYNASLPNVGVMPPIGPLAHRESVLKPDYVRTSASTSRSPLHFRNQLFWWRDELGSFKELAERSWPGFRLRDLTITHDANEDTLVQLVQDGDFVLEVGLVGHGLQVWLQTMLFLSRMHSDNIVILDEPDVYLHADMQRKLIRILRDRYKQVIIATHSTEIMAEVSPDQLVAVERKNTSSASAAGLEAAQQIMRSVNSVHNLYLLRLVRSQKFLYLEGDDLDLLKPLQDTLYPQSGDPIDAVPHASIGGWSGWERLVHPAEGLHNAVGEEIRTYCILDHDYFQPETVRERLKQARSRGIELHVWSKKELENYLIVPSAIQRLVKKQCSVPILIPSMFQS